MPLRVTQNCTQEQSEQPWTVGSRLCSIKTVRFPPLQFLWEDVIGLFE